MSEPRLDFNLSLLEMEIIKERMLQSGYDISEDGFDKSFENYFNKIMFQAMDKIKFKTCDETTCKVSQLRFKKKISTKKLQFIQCTATKKNTTLSNVVSAFLLRG